MATTAARKQKLHQKQQQKQKRQQMAGQLAPASPDDDDVGVLACSANTSVFSDLMRLMRLMLSGDPQDAKQDVRSTRQQYTPAAHARTG